MNIAQRTIPLILFLFLSSTGHAEEYKSVEITKLITSSTSSNGQPLNYLHTDHPEVTAALVRIFPGNATGWHQHPVPVYAYMLEGALTVAMKDGKKYIFKKGDAILEVMNTLHNGYNSGSEPATLVVFYTGSEGVPNVIKENYVPTPPAH